MKNFDFKEYLIENLRCKYSEDHYNRLDHEENGYYIFFDDDSFMVFDLGDESGWIHKIPLDKDDFIVHHLEEIFANMD